MDSTEQVAAPDTPSSQIECLCKAVLELEACKVATGDKVQWAEIEEHFHNLEKTLKEKSEELEAREKEYEKKEADAHSLIAEREAAVASKKQELLDRMQDLKDAAVAAISEARATHQQVFVEPLDGEGCNNAKVSSHFGDTVSSDEDFDYKIDENAENMSTEAKPCPELMLLCEQMDARGLLNFVMENKKKLYTLCQELSGALESAGEPARLVLDSLEGFYPPDETTQPDEGKDAALSGMCKSCIILLEAMAALLARHDPGGGHLLNPEIKQQAKAIADEWKPKLPTAGVDAADGKSLAAEAFLQLLSTFRIASEFDLEELCKLVVVVSCRRQAPELCRSLELTQKMPGIIEVLVKNGRQVDAVRFIHAFGLTETFSPVLLLKTFLNDLRRNSQGKGGNTSGSGIQIDANAQELAALKAVISCVEDYNLEADYPLDPLKKRVTQLDKCKSDRKRSGDFRKRQQSKKPRPSTGFRRFRAPASRQAPPVYNGRVAYAGMIGRYPHRGPNSYDYQVVNTKYAQASDQRLYYYSEDERITATSNSSAMSAYGSYMASGLQQPPHQPYM